MYKSNYLLIPFLLEIFGYLDYVQPEVSVHRGGKL